MTEREMRLLKLLEELLSITEQARDLLPSDDHKRWGEIATETADIREVTR